MKVEKGSALRAVTHIEIDTSPLHPVWSKFIRYCAELQHGEIELLKIQDGLPMLAEAVKKKIKFAP
ncbi:MAG: hypothetical protein ABR555_05575 [Pyrinomonadaceae bacterium]